MVLLWTKLNPIHPRMLCAKFGWIDPVVLEKKIFIILSMNFRYFVIISPWKRVGPFICTKLNPLHKRMLHTSIFHNLHPVIISHLQRQKQNKQWRLKWYLNIFQSSKCKRECIISYTLKSKLNAEKYNHIIKHFISYK